MAHLNDYNFFNNKKRNKGQTKKKAEKIKKKLNKTKRNRKKQKKETKNQKKRRASSLGPKPSSFFFCCFVSFPFFASNRPKALFFPLEKGILCLFLLVSLCFPLAFFGIPLFSLSLSLFLFFYLSFFLPVFLFLFYLASWFLFFFCLFFLLCFCFMITNNIKVFNHKVFLHQYFLYFGFLSCLLFEILLSYFCFPDFKLCFCSNIKWLIADQRKA